MNRRALASKVNRRVLASYSAGISQKTVFVIVLCLWTTIETQASKVSSESDQTVRASQEHTNAIHDRSRPSFRLSSVVRFYPKVVGPLPGPICDATLWADSASTIQNVDHYNHGTSPAEGGTVTVIVQTEEDLKHDNMTQPLDEQSFSSQRGRNRSSGPLRDCWCSCRASDRARLGQFMEWQCRPSALTRWLNRIPEASRRAFVLPGKLRCVLSPPPWRYGYKRARIIRLKRQARKMWYTHTFSVVGPKLIFVYSDCRGLGKITFTRTSKSKHSSEQFYERSSSLVVMECLIIFLLGQAAWETMKHPKDRLLSLASRFFGSMSERAVTSILIEVKLHASRVGMASDLTYSLRPKHLNSPNLFDIIHVAGVLSPPSTNIWVAPVRRGVADLNTNTDFDRYGDRLRSLENLPLSCPLSASRAALAAAGFHYSPQVDPCAVICHRCSASISLSSLGTGTPLAAHRAASPTCPAHGGPINGGSSTSNSGSTTSNGGPSPSNGGSSMSSDGSPTSNGGSPTSNGGTPTSNGGSPTSSGRPPTSNCGSPTSSCGSTASSGRPLTSNGWSQTSTAGSQTPAVDSTGHVGFGASSASSSADGRNEDNVNQPTRASTSVTPPSSAVVEWPADLDYEPVDMQGTQDLQVHLRLPLDQIFVALIQQGMQPQIGVLLDPQEMGVWMRQPRISVQAAAVSQTPPENQQAITPTAAGVRSRGLVAGTALGPRVLASFLPGSAEPPPLPTASLGNVSRATYSEEETAGRNGARAASAANDELYANSEADQAEDNVSTTRPTPQLTLSQLYIDNRDSAIERSQQPHNKNLSAGQLTCAVPKRSQAVARHLEGNTVSPTSPQEQQQLQYNINTSPQGQNARFNGSESRRDHGSGNFVNFTDRLRSFRCNGWQTVCETDLAEAGFYAVDGMNVQCFSCGQRVRREDLLEVRTLPQLLNTVHGSVQLHRDHCEWCKSVVSVD